MEEIDTAKGKIKIIKLKLLDLEYEDILRIVQDSTIGEYRKANEIEKYIKQRIQEAVQRLIKEIENRKEMLEQTIFYVTQKRKCSVKARIDELDTILWKIKKYFPEEANENGNMSKM